MADQSDHEREEQNPPVTVSGMLQKARIWRAILLILFAPLVSGIFYILYNLKEAGTVVAWTLSALTFVGIVAALVYGFIVERISAVAAALADVVNNVAKGNELRQVLTNLEGLGRDVAKSSELQQVLTNLQGLGKDVAKSSELQQTLVKVVEAANIIKSTYSTATKELVVAAEELGLAMVYKTRAQVEAEIGRLLEHAKKEVRFLGISISMPTRVAAYRDLIVRKANEDVSFQFAFLDRKHENTHFDFYGQRASDERMPGDLRGEATTNVDALRAVRRDLGAKRGNLEVAEYRAFPYMSMVIIDDEMFVGPYLFGENCPNTPMFRIVRRDNGIYYTYEKHFRDLWKEATKIED